MTRHDDLAGMIRGLQPVPPPQIRYGVVSSVLFDWTSGTPKVVTVQADLGNGPVVVTVGQLMLNLLAGIETAAGPGGATGYIGGRAGLFASAPGGGQPMLFEIYGA